MAEGESCLAYQSSPKLRGSHRRRGPNGSERHRLGRRRGTLSASCPFAVACPGLTAQPGRVSPLGGVSMTDPFTPNDITRLSEEIDRQLLALGTPGTGLARGGTAEQALPTLQRRALEQATGQDAMTFLQRFKQ